MGGSWFLKRRLMSSLFKPVVSKALKQSIKKTSKSALNTTKKTARSAFKASKRSGKLTYKKAATSAKATTSKIKKKIPKKYRKNPFKKPKKNKLYPDLSKMMKAGKKPSKVKRYGKALAKSAAIAGLGTGAELGIMYGVHKLRGGDTPSAKQVKEATLEAGLGVASKAMKGNVGPKTVTAEVTKAFRNQIKKTPRSGKQKLSNKQIGEMSQLARAMSRAAQERLAKKKGKTKNRYFKARQFGTGMGAKKKPKKKPKKGGKKAQTTGMTPPSARSPPPAPASPDRSLRALSLEACSTSKS